MPCTARWRFACARTGGSGTDFDYWHWDNVVVTEVAVPGALVIGGCDDFESGLSAIWNINQTSGFAGISSATSQSPSNSLFLNGGVVDVESSDIDTDDITFSDVSLWIRRGSDAFSEDPDGGENLVVEYRNDVGTWIALETFTGAGTPGQTFPRTYPMPASARHAGFRLRFRMTGGSGAPWDFWHVDDVCLDQNPDPIMQVSKIQMPLSDPINGTSGPRAIPGAIVQYTVSVTNQGIGSVDAGTLEISDVVPPDTAMFVSTATGDPVSFVDGSPSSGLTYVYGSHVSYTDNAGGVGPFDYVPTPDAQGFDPLVTGFQVVPAGSMLGNTGAGPTSFNVVFRVRIE